MKCGIYVQLNITLLLNYETHGQMDVTTKNIAHSWILSFNLHTCIFHLEYAQRSGSR